MRSGGEHHAWSVIVAEHQRALDRTGGKDNGLRAQGRDHLARLPASALRLSRRMSRHEAHHVAIVKAEGGGAPQYPDVRASRKGFLDAGAPGLARIIEAPRQQLPAQQAVLFDQKHARACISRRKCRGKSGGACANDQHVGKFIAGLITVRIPFVHRAPEPRGAADERFVEHP